MTASPLDLTRPQILAFRRRVGALDVRLPRGRRSLRLAAWAGLQDSMPRAALLSIHARVEGTEGRRSAELPGAHGSGINRDRRTANTTSDSLAKPWPQHETADRLRGRKTLTL